jgi:hypothetical protein
VNIAAMLGAPRGDCAETTGRRHRGQKRPSYISCQANRAAYRQALFRDLKNVGSYRERIKNAVRAQPEGIIEGDRIPTGIRVQIDAAREPDGILGQQDPLRTTALCAPC